MLSIAQPILTTAIINTLPLYANNIYALASLPHEFILSRSAAFRALNIGISISPAPQNSIVTPPQINISRGQII